MMNESHMNHRTTYNSNNSNNYNNNNYSSNNNNTSSSNTTQYNQGKRYDAPTTKSSSSSSSSSSYKLNLRSFDIYTKLDKDYKVQTSHGGILSIIGWIIISILVLSEVSSYLKYQTKEHMIVDTTLGQSLKININITFHALTCNEAHLDAMDVAGDNQLNIEHQMVKQRLTPTGQIIGDEGIELIGIIEKHDEEQLPPDYCGSCYGAESDQITCCNTCDDLKRAYQIKGWNWAPLIRNATQCVKENSKFITSSLPGEGCRISGSMIVNKVAGNFHIAHGESIVRDGRHIHQFIPAEAPGFNVSHTINKLSFGEVYPYMPPNPLDNVERIVVPEIGTGLFQYFIKVIPTIYTSERGKRLNTNQYTITERFRPLNMPDITNTNNPQSAVLPGIFFVYELSPFMVEVKRERAPFSHLFTKLCAIIGGVFTVMGVFDSTLYKFLKLWSPKLK